MIKRITWKIKLKAIQNGSPQYYFDNAREEDRNKFINTVIDLLELSVVNTREALQMANGLDLDDAFVICVYAKLCAFEKQNYDDRLCELLKIINKEHQEYIVNMILRTVECRHMENQNQIQNMNQRGLQNYLDSAPDDARNDFVEKANCLLNNIDHKQNTLDTIDALGLKICFFICVYAEQNNDSRLSQLLQIIYERNQDDLREMILLNKPNRYDYNNMFDWLPGDEDAVRLIKYIMKNINENIFDKFEVPQSSNLKCTNDGITTENDKQWCHVYWPNVPTKKYENCISGNSNVQARYLCESPNNQSSQQQANKF